MIDLADSEKISDAFLYAATLSPGFLISWFRSRFVTGRTESKSEYLIAFLVISAIYYSSVGLLFLEFGWVTGVGLSVLLFVVPSLLGIFIGISYQWRFLDKIFEFLRINPIHPASTAWDFAFGRMKEPQWVIVTLKSGTRLRGRFARQSGASSDASRLDIFIEDLRGSEFEALEPDGRKRSVWIDGNDISYIEFV